MPFTFPTLWLPKTDASSVPPSQVTSSWAANDCAIASSSLDQQGTAINELSATLVDVSSTLFSASFVVLTGTTTTGTFALFDAVTAQVQLSATLAEGSTGSFVVLTASAITGSSSSGTLKQAATGSFLLTTGVLAQHTTVTGTTVTGSMALFQSATIQFLSAPNFTLPGSASFTTLTGTTTTGTTAIFTTITGTTVTGTTAQFATITGTQAVISGTVSRKLSSSLNTVYASYSSASMSFINNTFTIVNFTSKSIDTDNAVTTGSSWKFTCPSGKDGLYHVTAAAAAIPVASMAEAAGAIYLNGNQLRVSTIQLTGSSSPEFSVKISCVVSLTGTDFIDFRLFQTNGAASTLSSRPTLTFNWIDIARIPGS